MNTAAFIHTYPGANEDLKVLWPYMQRNMKVNDWVTVGTLGRRCWHPPNSNYVEIGEDRYVSGDHLPRRLTDTIEHMLRTFPHAERIIALEYDVLITGLFPKDLPSGFCALRVGGRIDGCESTYFCHWPIAGSRDAWERWLPVARRLLQQGRIEKGTPDAFHALATQEAHIPMHFDVWKGFSRNTIHGSNPANAKQPDFLPEARAAFRDGCIAFHGVKTSRTYACRASETIRYILS